MATRSKDVRLGPVFSAVPFVGTQSGVYNHKTEKNRNGFGSNQNGKNQNLPFFLQPS